MMALLLAIYLAFVYLLIICFTISDIKRERHYRLEEKREQASWWELKEFGGKY